MGRASFFGMALCVLVTIAGCVVGRVLVYGPTGSEPVVGAHVFIRGCPTCQWEYLQTDSEGYYAWDPYDENGLLQPSEVIIPPYGEEAIEIMVSTADDSVRVYHKPSFSTLQTVAGERQVTFVPNIYVSPDPRPPFPASIFWDLDGDGVPGNLETTVYGTDPLNPDTDRDGLSDGTEIYGMNWVDYAGLGADPLHRDVFYHVDYRRMGYPIEAIQLSEEDIARVDEAFLHAPISNPDGVDGIDVHFAQGTFRSWPAATDCEDVYTLPDNLPERRRAGFRYALLCAEVNGFCYGQYPTQGERTQGNHLMCSDNTESLIHEIGHNLWLTHAGGGEGRIAGGVNFKPNYGSVMNYRYSNTHVIAPFFAHERVGGIHELIPFEETPFLGAGDDAAIVLNITAPGLAIPSPLQPGEYDVNWNDDVDAQGNPLITRGVPIPPMNLRFNAPAHDYLFLRDYDDYLAMETGIVDSIPFAVPVVRWVDDNNLWYYRNDRGQLRPTEWDPPMAAIPTPFEPEVDCEAIGCNAALSSGMPTLVELCEALGCAVGNDPMPDGAPACPERPQAQERTERLASNARRKHGTLSRLVRSDQARRLLLDAGLSKADIENVSHLATRFMATDPERVQRLVRRAAAAGLPIRKGSCEPLALERARRLWQAATERRAERDVTESSTPNLLRSPLALPQRPNGPILVCE